MPFLRPRVPLCLLAGAVFTPIACLLLALRADAAGARADAPAAARPTAEPAAAPVLSRKVVREDAPRADAAVNVPVTVQLADLNSGETIERSECVTVATGVRSAYECGDLRMVHPLPAFRTRNKARTAVLLYNSQHAHPRPTVYADVTLPAGAPVPYGIYASVVIGGVTVATASWPGGDWQPGTSRRVALQWDGLNTPTGVYAYTLQIVTVYGSTQVPSTPATDSLAVVNRSASPFGAGWWLAGWEELVPFGTGFLWVGGDGSTRVFVPDGTDRWTAWNPAGPRDELVKITSATTGEVQYRRYLRGGGATHFRINGKHFRTTPRLGGCRSGWRRLSASPQACLRSGDSENPVWARSTAVYGHRTVSSGGSGQVSAPRRTGLTNSR